MIFKTQGKLHYSPKLLGAASDKWWLVIDCDPEIGRYYRHLYFLDSHGCRRIQAAAWKEHVTVIRDEEPATHFKPLWELHEGLEVELECHTTVESDGSYFWLPVECGFVLDLREQLGLPRDPNYPLHLTIGNRLHDLL